MRPHLRVLFITIVAAAVGWAGVAEAAPFVSRPLTLSRSDWSLDLGLGLHHIRYGNPENNYTGFGMNLEAAVGMFHQSGAAFHPIAVVAVQNAVDVSGFRVMDVAGNHAIEAAASGLTRQSMLEVRNERRGVFHLVLQIR